MATRYIYVLKRNGYWGTSDWKSGDNLKQSDVQSLEGAVEAAERMGYDEQSKGHEYIIFIESSDGIFSSHRKSPGAADDFASGQIGANELKVPD